MDVPEFKPDALEIWSSVGLTALLIFVSTYASWLAASVGVGANFHLTHGIVVSWVGFLGVQISILAAVLSWRGFGLNAVAALLGASSLSTALIDTGLYRQSLTTVLSVGILVAAIHFTRPFFEHNPLLTFLGLWGLTFASSISQSLFYKFLFDHSYPLQGVLLLKFLLFIVGGLMVFFIFPRKNKVYVI